MAASTMKHLKQVVRFATVVRQCRFLNIRAVCMSQNSNESSSPQDFDKKNPFPLYASKEVQQILRRITGYDVMKVAGPHKVPLERPVYKLLTDEELAREQEAARIRLSKRLEMPPPYMNPRQPVKEPLAVDPDLAHFDTSSYVFSDISFGVKDRERSVVVREIDGTLRMAPWDVRERMNQLYNPREGRSVIKPQMFEEEHMERLISNEKYVYILERACAQFEPDDPDFLRVSHRVYSAVNSSKQFDMLRSTRFFAPLTFHLVWNKMIDLLLIDMLTKNMESDARDLVQLYAMTHTDGACAEGFKSIDQLDTESVMKVFLNTEAHMQKEVELALQVVIDAKKATISDTLSS